MQPNSGFVRTDRDFIMPQPFTPSYGMSHDGPQGWAERCHREDSP